VAASFTFTVSSTSGAANSDHFISILEEHYPTWREARAELNELPLTAEVWNE
jgi:hypothetical protein